LLKFSAFLRDEKEQAPRSVYNKFENLMTFPFVQKAVDAGQMQTHGAYFGVAEGSLFVLDKVAKEFKRANGE